MVTGLLAALIDNTNLPVAGMWKVKYLRDAVVQGSGLWITRGSEMGQGCSYVPDGQITVMRVH